MSRRTSKWLIVAVLFQGAVLGGMWVKSALPLWTGTEVSIVTRPVDPRSLFRGNYVRLSYGINDIENQQALNTHQLRQGEVVYQVLIKGDGGIYQKGPQVLNKPEEGIFIKGRLDKSRSKHQIKYGIDAFFAPKEKTLALEKQLRSGAVAVLKVTDSGQAGILRVEEKP